MTLTVILHQVDYTAVEVLCQDVVLPPRGGAEVDAIIRDLLLALKGAEGKARDASRELRKSCTDGSHNPYHSGTLLDVVEAAVQRLMLRNSPQPRPGEGCPQSVPQPVLCLLSDFEWERRRWCSGAVTNAVRELLVLHDAQLLLARLSDPPAEAARPHSDVQSLIWLAECLRGVVVDWPFITMLGLSDGTVGQPELAAVGYVGNVRIRNKKRGAAGDAPPGCAAALGATVAIAVIVVAAVDHAARIRAAALRRSVLLRCVNVCASGDLVQLPSGQSRDTAEVDRWELTLSAADILRVLEARVREGWILTHYEWDKWGDALVRDFEGPSNLHVQASLPWLPDRGEPVLQSSILQYQIDEKPRVAGRAQPEHALGLGVDSNPYIVSVKVHGPPVLVQWFQHQGLRRQTTTADRHRTRTSNTTSGRSAAQDAPSGDAQRLGMYVARLRDRDDTLQKLLRRPEVDCGVRERGDLQVVQVHSKPDGCTLDWLLMADVRCHVCAICDRPQEKWTKVLDGRSAVGGDGERPTTVNIGTGMHHIMQKWDVQDQITLSTREAGFPERAEDSSVYLRRPQSGGVVVVQRLALNDRSQDDRPTARVDLPNCVEVRASYFGVRHHIRRTLTADLHRRMPQLVDRRHEGGAKLGTGEGWHGSNFAFLGTTAPAWSPSPPPECTVVRGALVPFLRHIMPVRLAASEGPYEALVPRCDKLSLEKPQRTTDTDSPSDSGAKADAQPGGKPTPSEVVRHPLEVSPLSYHFVFRRWHWRPVEWSLGDPQRPTHRLPPQTLRRLQESDFLQNLPCQIFWTMVQFRLHRGYRLVHYSVVKPATGTQLNRFAVLQRQQCDGPGGGGPSASAAESPQRPAEGPLILYSVELRGLAVEVRVWVEQGPPDAGTFAAVRNSDGSRGSVLQHLQTRYNRILERIYRRDSMVVHAHATYAQLLAMVELDPKLWEEEASRRGRKVTADPLLQHATVSAKESTEHPHRLVDMQHRKKDFTCNRCRKKNTARDGQLKRWRCESCESPKDFDLCDACMTETDKAAALDPSSPDRLVLRFAKVNAAPSTVQLWELRRAEAAAEKAGKAPAPAPEADAASPGDACEFVHGLEVDLLLDGHCTIVNFPGLAPPSDESPFIPPELKQLLDALQPAVLSPPRDPDGAVLLTAARQIMAAPDTPALRHARSILSGEPYKLRAAGFACDMTAAHSARLFAAITEGLPTGDPAHAAPVSVGGELKEVWNHSTAPAQLYLRTFNFVHLLSPVQLSVTASDFPGSHYPASLVPTEGPGSELRRCAALRIFVRSTDSPGSLHPTPAEGLTVTVLAPPEHACPVVVDPETGARAFRALLHEVRSSNISELFVKVLGMRADPQLLHSGSSRRSSSASVTQFPLSGSPPSSATPAAKICPMGHQGPGGALGYQEFLKNVHKMTLAFVLYRLLQHGATVSGADMRTAQEQLCDYGLSMDITALARVHQHPGAPVMPHRLVNDDLKSALEKHFRAVPGTECHYFFCAPRRLPLLTSVGARRAVRPSVAPSLSIGAGGGPRASARQSLAPSGAGARSVASSAAQQGQPGGAQPPGLAGRLTAEALRAREAGEHSPPHASPRGARAPTVEGRSTSFFSNDCSSHTMSSWGSQSQCADTPTSPLAHGAVRGAGGDIDEHSLDAMLDCFPSEPFPPGQAVGQAGTARHDVDATSRCESGGTYEIANDGLEREPAARDDRDDMPFFLVMHVTYTTHSCKYAYTLPVWHSTLNPQGPEPPLMAEALRELEAAEDPVEDVQLALLVHSIPSQFSEIASGGFLPKGREAVRKCMWSATPQHAQFHPERGGYCRKEEKETSRADQAGGPRGWEMLHNSLRKYLTRSRRRIEGLLHEKQLRFQLANPASREPGPEVVHRIEYTRSAAWEKRTVANLLLACPRRVPALSDMFKKCVMGAPDLQCLQQSAPSVLQSPRALPGTWPEYLIVRSVGLQQADLAACAAALCNAALRAAALPPAPPDPPPPPATSPARAAAALDEALPFWLVLRLGSSKKAAPSAPVRSLYRCPKQGLVACDWSLAKVRAWLYSPGHPKPEDRQRVFARLERAIGAATVRLNQTLLLQQCLAKHVISNLLLAPDDREAYLELALVGAGVVLSTALVAAWQGKAVQQPPAKPEPQAPKAPAEEPGACSPLSSSPLLSADKVAAAAARGAVAPRKQGPASVAGGLQSSMHGGESTHSMLIQVPPPRDAVSAHRSRGFLQLLRIYSPPWYRWGGLTCTETCLREVELCSHVQEEHVDSSLRHAGFQGLAVRKRTYLMGSMVGKGEGDVYYFRVQLVVNWSPLAALAALAVLAAATLAPPPDPAALPLPDHSPVAEPESPMRAVSAPTSGEPMSPAAGLPQSRAATSSAPVASPAPAQQPRAAPGSTAAPAPPPAKGAAQQGAAPAAAPAAKPAAQQSSAGAAPAAAPPAKPAAQQPPSSPSHTAAAPAPPRSATSPRAGCAAVAASVSIIRVSVAPAPDPPSAPRGDPAAAPARGPRQMRTPEKRTAPTPRDTTPREPPEEPPRCPPVPCRLKARMLFHSVHPVAEDPGATFRVAKEFETCMRGATIRALVRHLGDTAMGDSVGLTTENLHDLQVRAEMRYEITAALPRVLHSESKRVLDYAKSYLKKWAMTATRAEGAVPCVTPLGTEPFPHFIYPRISRDDGSRQAGAHQRGAAHDNTASWVACLHADLARTPQPSPAGTATESEPFGAPGGSPPAVEASVWRELDSQLERNITGQQGAIEPQIYKRELPEIPGVAQPMAALRPVQSIISLAETEDRTQGSPSELYGEDGRFALLTVGSDPGADTDGRPRLRLLVWVSAIPKEANRALEQLEDMVQSCVRQVICEAVLELRLFPASAPGATGQLRFDAQGYAMARGLCLWLRGHLSREATQLRRKGMAGRKNPPDGRVGDLVPCMHFSLPSFLPPDLCPVLVKDAQRLLVDLHWRFASINLGRQAARIRPVVLTSAVPGAPAPQGLHCVPSWEPQIMNFYHAHIGTEPAEFYVVAARPVADDERWVRRFKGQCEDDDPVVPPKDMAGTDFDSLRYYDAPERPVIVALRVNQNGIEILYYNVKSNFVRGLQEGLRLLLDDMELRAERGLCVLHQKLGIFLPTPLPVIFPDAADSRGGSGQARDAMRRPPIAWPALDAIDAELAGVGPRAAKEKNSIYPALETALIVSDRRSPQVQPAVGGPQGAGGGAAAAAAMRRKESAAPSPPAPLQAPQQQPAQQQPPNGGWHLALLGCNGAPRPAAGAPTGAQPRPASGARSQLSVFIDITVAQRAAAEPALAHDALLAALEDARQQTARAQPGKGQESPTSREPVGTLFIYPQPVAKRDPQSVAAAATMLAAAVAARAVQRRRTPPLAGESAAGAPGAAQGQAAGGPGRGAARFTPVQERPVSLDGVRFAPTWSARRKHADLVSACARALRCARLCRSARAPVLLNLARQRVAHCPPGEAVREAEAAGHGECAQWRALLLRLLREYCECLAASAPVPFCAVLANPEEPGRGGAAADAPKQLALLVEGPTRRLCAFQPPSYFLVAALDSGLLVLEVSMRLTSFSIDLYRLPAPPLAARPRSVLCQLPEQQGQHRQQAAPQAQRPPPQRPPQSVAPQQPKQPPQPPQPQRPQGSQNSPPQRQHRHADQGADPQRARSRQDQRAVGWLSALPCRLRLEPVMYDLQLQYIWRCLGANDLDADLRVRDVDWLAVILQTAELYPAPPSGSANALAHRTVEVPVPGEVLAMEMVQKEGDEHPAPQGPGGYTPQQALRKFFTHVSRSHKDWRILNSSAGEKGQDKDRRNAMLLHCPDFPPADAPEAAGLSAWQPPCNALAVCRLQSSDGSGGDGAVLPLDVYLLCCATEAARIVSPLQRSAQTRAELMDCAVRYFCRQVKETSENEVCSYRTRRVWKKLVSGRVTHAELEGAMDPPQLSGVRCAVRTQPLPDIDPSQLTGAQWLRVCRSAKARYQGEMKIFSTGECEAALRDPGQGPAHYVFVAPEGTAGDYPIAELHTIPAIVVRFCFDGRDGSVSVLYTVSDGEPRDAAAAAPPQPNPGFLAQWVNVVCETLWATECPGVSLGAG
eukprot:TRINITY_DN12415_c0_g4_i1.p1 TRINITY_DN12415_c0_g4~~TRINITY_DN12415_c0_g4_i1.p1  ORF type:complete len:4079 (+),score=1210.32 TRINITY_DN12415_c0_g4_i1:143-12379(+)